MAKKGRLSKDEQERLKEHAKLLYTKENITLQKELAERVGVSEKTIGIWINDGGWTKLKKNFILTREEQLANLLSELEAINAAIKTKPEGQRFADSKEANVRRYLIRDIKDLETKALLPELISSQTQFLDFVRKTYDLDTTKLVAGYVDAFIKSKLH